MPLLPPVVWAERPDVLLITIAIQDATDVKINITAEAVEFSGKADKQDYAVKLDLKKEVVPEESSQAVRPRGIELKLKKKEEGPYWETMTKKKMTNVKIDWGKWKDEDDLGGGDDLGDFGMGGMPGMGGMGGMPGMGGMGGMPGMGGMGMPGGMDLSALGGMNLGGGGDPEDIQKMMGDLKGGAGEGDSDDDDEMPGLEKQGDK
eukprot:TRINITY_DN170_c0_g1_i3.p2 TRINITY_DN170_c0_g1~~TRINITY_DN170_c0_g1_i3.p2  ORF type:complete len:232 (+),score=96.37 TRINITY_DN170_c0_g1_i3:85-696(+)